MIYVPILIDALIAGLGVGIVVRFILSATGS